jgi:hypothetical protein
MVAAYAGTKKAVKRDNPRHCVVFNDVMVLLKPDNKGRLTFKNAIDLSRCTLRNIHVGAHAGPASAMAAAAMGIARFSFEIQAPDRAYVLMAASAASKARWMSELSRVIWRLAPVDLRGVTGWRHQLVVGTQWSAAIRASEEELEDMLIGSRRGCRDAGRDDSDDDSDDALFVDDADAYGWTALHYAAYIGHAGMVGLLLSHGADANVSAPDDTTPLHVAVSRRHADAVAALVSNGASLVARNAAGASAMLMCVQSADSGFASTCMQTLLVHGGSATWTDADGVSLLHHAVLHGQAALIALLSRAGGRTNVLATVEELRVTPLLLACSRPSVDVAVIAALLKVRRWCLPLRVVWEGCLIGRRVLIDSPHVCACVRVCVSAFFFTRLVPHSCVPHLCFASPVPSSVLSSPVCLTSHCMAPYCSTAPTRTFDGHLTAAVRCTFCCSGWTGVDPAATAWRRCSRLPTSCCGTAADWTCATTPAWRWRSP